MVVVVVAGNSKEEKGGGGFGSHQGKVVGETFYQGGEWIFTTKMGDLNGGWILEACTGNDEGSVVE